LANNEKGSIVNRDNIQTLAALVGLITALLYVFGYVADRLHWNFYGHVVAPSDHIEFLYRGGNIILSTITSFLLYLLLGITSVVRLILVSILLLFAATFPKLPKRLAMRSSIQSCYPLLWITFLLLVIVLLRELLLNVPSVPDNLLFQTNTLDNSARSDYFQRYSGVLILWFMFFLVGRRSLGFYSDLSGSTRQNEEAPDVMLAGQEQVGQLEGASSQWAFIIVGQGVRSTARTESNGENDGLKEGRPQGRIDTLSLKGFRFLSIATLAVVFLLFSFLPILYATFQYPDVYPIVEVNLASNAGAIPQTIASPSLNALLFETGDDYFLYQRTPARSILVLKKSSVSLLTIRRSCDITEDKCFSPASPSP
jgi:hypothetical protein